MSHDPAPSFAAMLKEFRLRHKQTQRQLADDAHLSIDAVSTLERGLRLYPQMTTIALLADALGLNVVERVQFAQAGRRPRSSDPPRQVSHADTPFIGRSAELAIVSQHLATATQHVILLGGTAGVGKTSLLAEIAQRATQTGWHVLHSRCLRHQVAQPYAPLLDIIEHYVDEQPQRHLVRKALADCPWLLTMQPYLAKKLRLTIARPQIPEKGMPNRIFADVRHFFTTITTASKQLLLIDDLQWLNGDASAMLANLMQLTTDKPLVLIGAYRADEVEYQHPLAQMMHELHHVGIQRYDLQPFTQAESDEFLRPQLAGRTAAEAATIQTTLFRRTAGHPYYLSIYRDELQHHPQSDLQKVIPWNITRAILNRVHTLAAPAQELLQVIALIDSPIAFRHLLAVALHLGLDRATMVATLGTLRRAQLIKVAAKMYVCDHDLVGEVMRAALDETKQLDLHWHIAEALANSAAAVPVDLLARHYSAAEYPEKALVYLRRAAEQAQRLYAHARARAYYEQIIHVARMAQADREDVYSMESAYAYEQLGFLHTIQGHYTEAITSLEHAIGAYQLTGDHEGECRCVAYIGHAYAQLGDADSGTARLQMFLSMHAATAPSASLAALYIALAELHHIGGADQEELAAASTAVTLAEHMDDLPLLVRAKGTYAHTLVRLSHIEQATPYLKELITQAQQAGDIMVLGQALQDLTLAHMFWGDWRSDAAYIDMGLVVAQQIDNPIMQAFFLFRRGEMKFWKGDWDDALTDLMEASERSRAVGPSWMSCLPLIGAGFIQSYRGEATIAVNYYDEADDLMRNHPGLMIGQHWLAFVRIEKDLRDGHIAAASNGLHRYDPDAQEDTFLRPLVALHWAEICLAQDDLAEAEQHIAVAIADATARHMHPRRADALRVRGLLLLKRGNLADAEAALQAAHAIYQTVETPYFVARLHCAWGAFYRESGAMAQARQQWEAALTILNHLGEKQYFARQAHMGLAALNVSD